MTRPIVVLGLPSYTGWRRHLGSLMAVLSSGYEIHTVESQSSLLTASFNMCWAQALNLRKERGATHFMLLHADVYPHGPWLRILLEEMTAVEADLLSVSSPIKSLTGQQLSVALESNDLWVPKILTQDDIPAATWTHPNLLVNTGCMLVSLTPSWIGPDLYFTIDDRIVEHEGRYVMRCAPEDWNFSRSVRDRGGRIFVTNKVELTHYGEVGFSNQLQTEPVS